MFDIGNIRTKTIEAGGEPAKKLKDLETRKTLSLPSEQDGVSYFLLVIIFCFSIV